jgi:hypothetical protein
MPDWSKQLFFGPHVVVFIGIIVTGIAEILRYAGDKKKNKNIESIGLLVLIAGLLISGAGGWWAAKEQSNFEEKVLGSVTGGDSFCYVMPIVDDSSGRTTLMLMHQGNFPVYNISLRVLDLTKMEILPFDNLFPKNNMSKQEWETLMKKRDIQSEFNSLREKATMRLELSILIPGSAYEFARFRIPNELNEQKYLVHIFTRNAKLSQNIIYRRIKGLWRRSMRVSRDIGGGKNHVILKEEIHPEIQIP